jgi:hypothetical protein
MFLTHALRAIYRSAVAASDALWEYVTLLLTGSPQTSTFVTDASTNNFQVTINGDTRPNNFSPYTTGYYSNYFDGTGDFLSNGSATGINVGTGNFTVEAWVYLNSNSNYSGVFSSWYSTNTSNGILLGFLNTGVLYAAVGNAMGGSAPVEITGSTVTTGFWHHVALVRNGTSHRLYLNGVNVATTTATAKSVDTTVFHIGKYYVDANNYYINGNISNLRFTNTDVYTANFTPPTAPLTAIANTSLLTCQSNRFIDTSTNAFAITVNGSTSISPFDPFAPSNTFRTYGSTYFDGTGDYLTVPYTTALQLPGNFTIECWVNITSKVSNFPTIVNNYSTYAANGGVAIFASHNGGTSGKYNIAFNGAFPVINSTTSINYGTWQHIALVRSGSTLTLYIDGVANGTSTQSATVTGTANNWWIGTAGDDFSLGYLNGYVSNFRVVKGTAVYTANFTPPTAPLTAIAGTSLLTLQTNQPISNNTFLDNSSLGSFITRNGNATQGSFSPYGGDWSNYFDGNGDYLGIANNAAFNFGTGAFTIECWFMLTADATADQDGGRGATLLCAFPNSGAFSSDWVLGLDGNTTTTGTSISFASRQSGTQQSTIYTSTITKNVWHHVAATRTGNTLSLYYDGVRVAQNTSFTNTVNSGGNLIKIGALLYSANLSGYMNYFPGYISNVRVVTGSVLYTGTTYTVPTTPLTAISGAQLLTCQSNSLIDNSLNRFAITRNGDVSVQPFSPFHPVSVLPVSYGAYFDGTGDWLNIANSTSLNLPGDFTVECWFNTFNASANQSIMGKWDATPAYGWVVSVNTTAQNVSLGIGNSGSYVTGNSWSATIGANIWYHLAITRSGSTIRAFLNGTQLTGTLTNSSNLSATAITYIGRDDSILRNFQGYLSNIRVINGTALYTSAFTPSTTPLTVVANTSLLTCQSDRFIDNSTNNFAITNNGDARPVTQNPFGSTSTLTTGYDVTTVGGSAYFDGTGDYLALPYTTAAFFLQNSYTIEAWVNPANVSTWKPIFTITAANTGGFGGLALVVGNAAAYAEVRPTTGGSISSITGGTIVPNVWHHIALSVNNTSARLFLNGVQVGSTVTFPNFSFTPVGAAVGVNANLFGTSTDIFNGYISDLRIIKGTALYTGPFVPPVAPVTAITNTTFLGNFANAGVIDYSGQGNLETVGGARVSTAVSKYSGSSLYFDGTGDYAVQPTNLNFGYGTGDFTIEFWLYLNTVSADQTIVSNLSSATSVNPHIYLNGASNTIRFFTNSADRITGSSLSANTWYHIAVCRASGSTKMFINGTQTGSTYTDANNYGTTAPIGIGTYWSSGSPVTTLTLNGYIDDLRITKAARYTANFTPPTAALPTF